MNSKKKLIYVVAVILFMFVGVVYFQAYKFSTEGYYPAPCKMVVAGESDNIDYPAPCKMITEDTFVVKVFKLILP